MANRPSTPEEIARLVPLARSSAERVLDAMGRVVIGQNHLKRCLLIGLLTEGHILLEGVPGLGKTLAIKTFAAAVRASFKRIQFTPDLLPADLIGTEVFRPQDGTFEVRQGPVFANIVLADEINRAPAKVQAALLETMQERQVTIGKETFRVPSPFLVLATQNPIEHEGTYPLPEAQLDRFLMKVEVSHPSVEEELRMLDGIEVGQPEEQLEPAIDLDEVARLKSICSMIYVDSRVKRYIVDVVTATRRPSAFGLKLDDLIDLGASPRSSIALLIAGRAEALLNGEPFVVPQNIKNVAPDILRHRILRSYEAEAQNRSADEIIRAILETVPVP